MEKKSRTKSVFILFYILCKNFSKNGPIIKKIPNFVNNALNQEVQEAAVFCCSS